MIKGKSRQIREYLVSLKKLWRFSRKVTIQTKKLKKYRLNSNLKNKKTCQEDLKYKVIERDLIQ